MTMVKTSNNKKRRRILAMLLCLCMVFPKFGNNVAHAEPEGNQPGVESEAAGESQIQKVIKVADAATFDDYMTILGDEDDGGRYAGRVWADKSVYKDSQTVSGKEIGINNDSDFLIRFSALGSSRVVQESAPVDIVLVLDISGSMGSPVLPEYEKIPDPDGAEYWPFITDDDCSRLRMAKLIPAVNKMMTSLMKNDKNRISIVLYDSSAYVLLPLAHYTQFENEDFISAAQHHWQSWSWTDAEHGKASDSEDKIRGQWACTITATYQGSSGSKEQKKVTSWSNTNIMAGISAGMDQLKPAEDDEDRIPVMILLSDGDANTIIYDNNTESYSDPIQWNQVANSEEISRYENNDYFTFNDNDSIFNGYYIDGSWENANLFSNDVSGDIKVYAGGEQHLYLTDNTEYKKEVSLATLMHAAFMKNKVKELYGGTSPMIYTIGYDTENLQYSSVVLNPKECLEDDELGIWTAWKKWYETGSADLKFSFANENNENKEKIAEYIRYNDKYFAGSSDDDASGSIQEVFDAICTEVTGLAFNPVRVGTGEETTFTYTDPIGEYMEVKEIKALGLFGKIYDNPIQADALDGSTTYTFSSGTEVIRNPGYIREPVVDISTIKIKVSEVDNNQILTVNIPAYALPIHCETVTMEKGTSKIETYKTNAEEIEPLQLWYTVGLIDNIQNNDGTINIDSVSEEYYKANTAESGNYVYFYSNLYDKSHRADGQDEAEAYGNTLVQFDPSKENRYYYFQKNRVIYQNGQEGVLGEGGSVEDPVSVSQDQSIDDVIKDEDTYYLVIDFYRPLNNGSSGGEEVKFVVARTGAELRPAVTTVEKILENNVTYSNGVVVTSVGGIRLGRLNRFTQPKKDNITSTSNQYYAPTYGLDHEDLNGDAETITIHLGNNGRLAIPIKPDITINKLQSVNGGEASADTLNVEPGDVITYHLEVSNQSESDAEDVIVTDPVPEGLILDESSVAPEGTAETGEDGRQVITWKLGTVEAGEKKTVEFKVTVPQVEETARWTNIAYVTEGDPDPDPEDPKIPSNPVEAVPGIRIEKTQQLNGEGNPTADLLHVQKGDEVTYYLTVTNTSETTAYDVIVKDQIPDDGKGNKLELAEGSAGEGELQGRTITWNIGDLGPGESRTVKFTVKVPAGGTRWKNMASASYVPGAPDDPGKPGPEEDRTPDIPSNEVEIDKNEADITIRKLQSVNGGEASADTLNVEPGDVITYHLEVSNQSESDAEDVIVTDPVPEGLILDESSVAPEGTAETGEDGRQVITWKLGTVEAGEKKTVEFKVTVPQVEETARWTNIAYVTEGDPDPDPEDPKIPSNPVEAVPGIRIEKTQQLNGEGNPTADLLHVQKGDEVTYYLTVTNTSETTAYDVIVKDQIPDDGKGNKLELVEGSAGEGELQGRTITWNIGDLGPGESRTVKFTVKVPAGGTSWKNMASASYVPGAPDDPGKPGPEEDRTPDIPSNEVEIDKNEADITIRKLQSVNGGEAVTGVLSVKPGDRITYRLTVGNKSGSAAEDVIVTDPVPSGLILDEDSITPEGTVETSQDGQQTITWNLGTLEAGGEKILEFQVTVPQTDKETRWTNIAYVTEGDPDPDPEDPKIPSNEVEAVTGIEVEKTQQVNGQGEPTTETLHVQKGDEVTYYLTVTNTSETKAFDVIVTDEIPADGTGNRLELVEGSVEGGQSRKVSGNVITWNIGVLEAGESQTVKFTVKVPADGGSWKNMAGASCVPGDPDDPEKPGPEEDRTPDIPSNEVEIEAGTTKIQLRARKVLNGADLTDGQFTFRIQGISAEITEESENENWKSETAQKPEETEETPEATPSNAERADDEAADSTDGERGIESAGLIKGVGKSLTANVMLQARIMAKGEGIARGSSAVPMPSVSTASNNEDGEIVFGEIEYAAAGIYTYKISEVKEMRSGYTFDTTEYTVEVAVSRSEADGELTAEVRIVKPEGADEIVFTNRYRKPSSGGGSPGGGGGSNPQPGPGTTPDPDPEIPDTTDPENPQPVPDTPGLPDPNDPNSPDTVTIEENGVPRTYVKVWDPVNEEFIYIPEEEVPLFGLLPKTGEEERRRWLGLILALSLAGLGTLTAGERLRRKKEREIR